MPKRARLVVRILLILVLVGLAVYRYRQAHQSQAQAQAPAVESTTGGTLVATLPSEPTSFNRYAVAETPTLIVALLTQEPLVRVNRVTSDLESRLAREWSSSPDGLTWTLKLREDVVFSDGWPFTAADVVFSFAALYDKRVGSPIATGFQVNGQPLTVRAEGDHTVVLTFPSPYGPGLAMLDSLPILPRHLLEPSLTSGTFAKAWGVTTPPAQMAGLGPFVLAEYVSGQRIRFTRNPHYWRRDDRGQPLPYLDELDLEIQPDQNAAALRLESGDLDLLDDPVRPEDMSAFTAAQTQGKLRLLEAGVATDPNMLWFNLAPNAPRAKDRPWLQREELRQAISYAVDRKVIVDTVYLGAAEPAYGPVTSGNREWFIPDLPKTEFDPAKAKALLASIGLTDRNGDGLLEDAAGKPARFSILTRKGKTDLERGAAVIQDQLRKVGLAVDIVDLDMRALLAQLSKGDYDAIYFHIGADSTDPARNLDFWLSSGSFHFWNPEQPKPTTPWEAQIDDLMRKQSTTIDRAERHRLFAEAQRVLAAHLPVLYFAAPKVTVAMSTRVAGAMPVVMQPYVLWSAETLRVTAPARNR
jgi:peptide/nickel transport system substrate-binding protein